MHTPNVARAPAMGGESWQTRYLLNLRCSVSCIHPDNKDGILDFSRPRLRRRLARLRSGPGPDTRNVFDAELSALADYGSLDWREGDRKRQNALRRSGDAQAVRMLSGWTAGATRLKACSGRAQSRTHTSGRAPGVERGSGARLPRAPHHGSARWRLVQSEHAVRMALY